MTKITEDYISFETAKLLKEKGFDGAVQLHYNKLGGKIYSSNPITKNCIKAPTLQMVMKWLREVYNIHISVYPSNRELPITENTSYTCDVATTKDSPMRGHLRGIWKTYEESLNAAIKYCLENLI